MYQNNKAYYTLDSYFRQIFNSKVIKIALDLGASCPNIDGTLSTGGCSFCDNIGKDYSIRRNTLSEQFYDGVKRIAAKWSNGLYMPYFQSNTNTYMSVEKLRNSVNEVIGLDKTIGISISTRPDCISEEMLDYLDELNNQTFLIAELGLQSANDDTLRQINRGHDFSAFEKCFGRLKARNIKVCVHIIDGLIGETKKDMLETARKLAKLKPDFLKIHLMYFVKGTLDTQRLQESKIRPLEKNEYIDILVSQLELMPPTTVIERLTGDADRRTLIAPIYSADKKGMLSAIDNAFRARNTYQGKLYVE